MSLFHISASPHIRHEENTTSVMGDVVVALIPLLIWGAYIFGTRAITVCAVSVLSCVLSEFIYQKLMKQPVTTGDLSAVVSGLLLGFNLPASIPLYIPALGGIFAMIVVKALFGGIGKNFVNPVLAARAVLFISWPAAMTEFTEPLQRISFFGKAVDTASNPTALKLLKTDVLPFKYTSLRDLFIGKCGGCIGEISTLLILACGLYLVVRKVITWHIPVSFIGTVAILTLAFAPSGVNNLQFMASELCSGGLMLGAVFMATDYVTSPVTPYGRIIYGIGCGAVTVFIRFFGGYPEGVSFAILIMNLFVWYLDKATKPVKFGGGKKLESKKSA